MVAGAAAMDAALVAPRLQLGLARRRSVGAVGPHLVAGVGLVQQLVELLAVVHRGVGLGPAADQLVLAVDADVVLVAVVALVVLLGPARILVLLRSLGRLVLPALGRPAGLDRRVLLAAVVLLGCADNGGVGPGLDPGSDRRARCSPWRSSSRCSNSALTRLALVSASRNSHTVVASGTTSSKPRPRKRMNESRSRI